MGDVTALLANSLGNGNKISITVYYRTANNNYMQHKEFDIKDGESQSLTFNYLDRIEMDSATAAVMLSSSAFDGQGSTAYFTTQYATPGTEDATYKNVWSSAGLDRVQWFYK